MNIARHVRLILKNAGLWLGLSVIVLSALVGALGFLIAGFFIWLLTHFGPAAAAAITGGVLLVLAVTILLLGGYVLRRMRRNQPGLGFGGMRMVLQLAAALVRSDPKRAVIFALLAGAMAEAFMPGKRKE